MLEQVVLGRVWDQALKGVQVEPWLHLPLAFSPDDEGRFPFLRAIDSFDN